MMDSGEQDSGASDEASQPTRDEEATFDQEQFDAQWKAAWIDMFEVELNRGEEEEEEGQGQGQGEEGEEESTEGGREEGGDEAAAVVEVEDTGQEETHSPETEEEEEEPLPNLMVQHSPLRMRLTPEETNWALEIKDAIELIPDIDDLNDFWMGQYALICKDNVNDAVDRAEALQSFRQEYRIIDSYLEGCRALQKFAELLPNYIIGWFFNPEKGSYMGALDSGQMSAQPLTSAEKMDQFFVGFYYIFQAMFPDLESIRKGCEFVVECGVMPRTTRQDYNLVMRMFRELFCVYPMTGSFKNYNSGVVYNAMFTVAKAFLPRELRERIEVGLQCEGGLHSLFLVPDAATAVRQVLQNMQENLRLRYENESTFNLP